MRHLACPLQLAALLCVLFTALPAAARSPRLHVLCVGVARYEEDRLDLDYADHDARDLAQVLAARTRRDFPRRDVQVLTNANATRPALLAAAHRLVRRSRPGDTVILFLSGHGVRHPKLGYVFLTHESTTAGYAHDGLVWSTLVAAMRPLRARQVLVFLDSCDAGEAQPHGKFKGLALGKQVPNVIFSSSGPRQDSMELPAKRHGVFTQALLEAFAGAADPQRDHRLTLGELFEWLPARVRALSKGLQQPRPPQLTGVDPEMVLGRY